MRSIPTLFFATAAIFALCGMMWGIEMAITQDHSLSPAHGHLNLVGFVAMSVFGTYYALTPQAANSALARFHYVLMTLAVVTLSVGIALAISMEQEMLAKIGSILAALSMAVFLFTIVRHGVGTKQTPPQS